MEAPEQLQVVLGFEKAKEAAGGEHFLVEDLLDFSNDDGCEADEDGALTESAIQTSAESAAGGATPARYCSSTSPVSGPEPHFLGEDLCAPYDPELEWFSTFVEESFADSSQKLHPVLSAATATAATVAATAPVAIPRNAASYQPAPPSPPLFGADGPIRCARSKRSRAAPSNWATRLLVLAPTNPIPMEGSLLLPPPLDPTPPMPKKPAKAPKKQHNPLEPSLAPNPDGRKCLHCATDKTPQWRTGPKGPKTLCNACGVRYKSGRLMPEYRPAASPTFMLSQHSNSHRKVMELRRQKELLHQQPSLPQQPPLPQHHGGGSVGAMAGMFAGHYHPGGGGFFDGSDDFLIHNPIGPDFRQLI